MKKTSIIAILILLSFSCKEIAKKDNGNLSENNNTSNTERIDKNQVPTKVVTENANIDVADLKLLDELDDICVEDDGVFKNCDELYTKKGSNVFFIIIPKIGASNWYQTNSKKFKGEIYQINDQLCQLVLDKKNKNSLINDFDVWAFYIDKKFTKKINLDTPFTPITPRETLLLKLTSSKEEWEIVETFKVKNGDDEVKENEWRDKKIEGLISNSNDKQNTANIPTAWLGKYSIYFDYGDIGGQNTGWELDIDISNSKITASGDGYQIGFLDELSFEKSNDGEIYLRHKKNISGYKLGQKMEPEFILKKIGEKFYIASKWITNDVKNKMTKNGYLIEKIQ